MHYIRAGVEIEHILPWTPLPGMKEMIKDYDNLKVLLGNLTLIEKSMNGAIGNKPFKEKVIEYAKSNLYVTRSIAKLDVVGTDTAINRINKFLRAYDHWDESTIHDRQEMLYNLSLVIWNLE